MDGPEEDRATQGAPQGAWEKWWPRFLAVLQAGLGTAVIVYELQSGTERPYLIAFAAAALAGAPLTGLAARILARSQK